MKMVQSELYYPALDFSRFFYFFLKKHEGLYRISRFTGRDSGGYSQAGRGNSGVGKEGVGMSGVTPSGTVKEYLTVEPCCLQAESPVVKECFATYKCTEMQTMKPYPMYKDSGVEWIGEVPEHWEVKRLKCHAKICNGHDHKKVWDENGKYPIIGTGGIFGRANDYLHPGPSVILGRKGTIDKPQFHESAFWSVDTAYYTDILPNTNPKFFFYLCSTINFDLYKYGSAVPSMTQEVLNQIELTAPPLSEQTAIATYLDRKTAEIDSLIANKERLIELYEEEKKAVINQAVTKGLDPDVEMKDSGVEWLGEVPAHWEVMRLRHLFEIKKRIAGKLGYDVLSITQQGIKIKDIKSMDGQISSDYSKYQLVMKGDFAMNHMDLLTGYVDLSKYNGVTSPDYRVFSLSDMNNIDQYFLYLFQLGYKRKIFYAFGRGAAQLGRWRFPTEEFKAFCFPVPPVAEQTAIVQHIETQCSRIDAIISKFKKQIELFKEYRTALISEAVTGKIDVRNNG